MDIHVEPRVLVLGDHLLARAGLAALLAPREDLQVVAQVAADESLLQQIEVYRPDVIIWDLGYAPLASVAAIASLIDMEIPLVLLLGEAEPVRSVMDALAEVAGIGYGVLRTQTHAAQLAAAVHAVLCGLVIIDPLLLEEVLPVTAALPFTLHDDLTPREMEVLQLLARGLPNKVIAQELEISPNTVKFHVNAILSKLDVQSRTEAVVRATQLGLVLL